MKQPARHMRRTEADLARLRPVLSLVLEVRDGRAPHLSAPHGVDRLLPGVPRAVVFTHRDDAFLPALEAAMAEIAPSVAVDARREGRALVAFVEGLLADRPRPARLAALGLPNVGKSSVMNRLLGRHGAATGARPGITKGVQWLRGPGFDLLDVPGLLLSRPTPELAALGLVPEGVVAPFDAAAALWAHGRGLLQRRYGIQAAEFTEFLSELAVRQGLGTRRHGPDLEAAARRLLSDYRKGRIGPIDWETSHDR